LYNLFRTSKSKAALAHCREAQIENDHPEELQVHLDARETEEANPISREHLLEKK